MIKVDPDPDAPLDIAALPDFWDARRERQGKPDKSTCAADLREALLYELARRQGVAGQ